MDADLRRWGWGWKRDNLSGASQFFERFTTQSASQARQRSTGDNTICVNLCSSAVVPFNLPPFAALREILFVLFDSFAVVLGKRFGVMERGNKWSIGLAEAEFVPSKLLAKAFGQAPRAFTAPTLQISITPLPSCRF